LARTSRRKRGPSIRARAGPVFCRCGSGVASARVSTAPTFAMRAGPMIGVTRSRASTARRATSASFAICSTRVMPRADLRHAGACRAACTPWSVLEAGSPFARGGALKDELVRDTGALARSARGGAARGRTGAREDRRGWPVDIHRFPFRRTARGVFLLILLATSSGLFSKERSVDARRDVVRGVDRLRTDAPSCRLPGWSAA